MDMGQSGQRYDDLPPVDLLSMARTGGHIGPFPSGVDDGGFAPGDRQAMTGSFVGAMGWAGAGMGMEEGCMAMGQPGQGHSNWSSTTPSGGDARCLLYDAKTGNDGGAMGWAAMEGAGVGMEGRHTAMWQSGLGCDNLFPMNQASSGHMRSVPYGSDEGGFSPGGRHAMTGNDGPAGREGARAADTEGHHNAMGQPGQGYGDGLPMTPNSSPMRPFSGEVKDGIVAVTGNDGGATTWATIVTGKAEDQAAMGADGVPVGGGRNKMGQLAQGNGDLLPTDLSGGGTVQPPSGMDDARGASPNNKRARIDAWERAAADDGGHGQIAVRERLDASRCQQATSEPPIHAFSDGAATAGGGPPSCASAYHNPMEACEVSNNRKDLENDTNVMMDQGRPSDGGGGEGSGGGGSMPVASDTSRPGSPSSDIASLSRHVWSPPATNDPFIRICFLVAAPVSDIDVCAASLTLSASSNRGGSRLMRTVALKRYEGTQGEPDSIWSSEWVLIPFKGNARVDYSYSFRGSRQYRSYRTLMRVQVEDVVWNEQVGARGLGIGTSTLVRRFDFLTGDEWERGLSSAAGGLTILAPPVTQQVLQHLILLKQAPRQEWPHASRHFILSLQSHNRQEAMLKPSAFETVHQLIGSEAEVPGSRLIDTVVLYLGLMNPMLNAEEPAFDSTSLLCAMTIAETNRMLQQQPAQLQMLSKVMKTGLARILAHNAQYGEDYSWLRFILLGPLAREIIPQGSAGSEDTYMSAANAVLDDVLLSGKHHRVTCLEMLVRAAPTKEAKRRIGVSIGTRLLKVDPSSPFLGNLGIGQLIQVAKGPDINGEDKRVLGRLFLSRLGGTWRGRGQGGRVISAEEVESVIELLGIKKEQDVRLIIKHVMESKAPGAHTESILVMLCRPRILRCFEEEAQYPLELCDQWVRANSGQDIIDTACTEASCPHHHRYCLY